MACLILECFNTGTEGICKKKIVFVFIFLHSALYVCLRPVHRCLWKCMKQLWRKNVNIFLYKSCISP